MRKLITYYPERLQASPEFKAIQDSLDPLLEQLWSDVDEFIAQQNVETATYGLAQWEEMLGILTHEGTDQERRERIKLKLRRPSTTTLAALQNLCQAYDVGTVTITEDYANYTVTLTYGDKGIPTRWADMENVLQEIKPAHLIINHKFNLYTHEELSAYTHQTLSTKTHYELRTEGGE